MFPGSSSSSRRPWAVAGRAHRGLIGAGLAIGLLAGTLAGATAAQAATAATALSGTPGATPASGPAGAAALGSTLACGAAKPGHVRCMARLSTLSGRVRHDSSAAGPVPGSYTPSDLASAYALPSGSAGGGQVVAIVDAFDDPTAEADLGVYRSQFSLRPCSSSNGCFRKVDQNGGTQVPAPDAGWATEVSLDLDMVSATCPLCSLVLVEDSSDSLTDIYRAVDEAVAHGAREVSLSLGSGVYPIE
ncbi:MAG: Neutral zinc metalloprotease, partial [Chloroflexi bacterium]|nr:Neutral zinc metalloprotease [Chloroflexota bacterium]